MAQRSTSRIAHLILMILLLCRLPLSAQPLQDLFHDPQVPVKSYSSLASLTPADGFFYFTLNDDHFGLELWRSDGTASGTYRVKDISPGPASAVPESLSLVNGLLWFTANDGVHGRELWRSDGTEAGTGIVKDIVPGENSSDLRILTSTNNALFLQVENETDGVQRWRTDGTPAGTVLLDSTSSETATFFPDHFTGLNSAIHSCEEGGLAFTDVQSPMHMIVVDQLLFFTADHPLFGRELWRSDGTREGTNPVKDIFPGSGTSSIHDLTRANELLYFSAYDGKHGSEVWRSNGTSSGTILLKDILPGGGSSHPRNFTAFNGHVYFSALGPDGIELWKTDGTVSGTLKVFPEAERVAKMD